MANPHALFHNLGNSQPKDKVVTCLDWQRGVCTKSPCKFGHPPGIPQHANRLKVCKNFQGRGCERMDACRFLHVSIHEEDEFYRSGNMPDHAGDPRRVHQNMIASGLTVADIKGKILQPGNCAAAPGGSYCKDFLNAICSRGQDCKFRHATQRELDLERQMKEMMDNMGMVAPNKQDLSANFVKAGAAPAAPAQQAAAAPSGNNYSNNQQGYNQQGYNQQGYDQQGYNQQGSQQGSYQQNQTAHLQGNNYSNNQGYQQGGGYQQDANNSGYQQGGYKPADAVAPVPTGGQAMKAFQAQGGVVPPPPPVQQQPAQPPQPDAFADYRSGQEGPVSANGNSYKQAFDPASYQPNHKPNNAQSNAHNTSQNNYNSTNYSNNYNNQNQSGWGDNSNQGAGGWGDQSYNQAPTAVNAYNQNAANTGAPQVNLSAIQALIYNKPSLKVELPDEQIGRLTKANTDMKRQINDLRKMNESLHEQNFKFRKHLMTVTQEKIKIDNYGDKKEKAAAST